MLHSVQSGIIQSVKPFVKVETYILAMTVPPQMNDSDTENMRLCNLDLSAPTALPEIPTTEAVYDGHTSFGVFIADESLNGYPIDYS